MWDGRWYVLCREFNYKDPVNRSFYISDHLADVLFRYNMVQHIHCATQEDGNLLDLIIKQESQSAVIADVIHEFIDSSDHRHVKCRLVVPFQRTAVVSYTYCDCKRMNMGALRRSLRESKLLQPASSLLPFDEYGELFNGKVKGTLDASLMRRMKRVGVS
jgi:hypothetical protein